VFYGSVIEAACSFVMLISCCLYYCLISIFGKNGKGDALSILQEEIEMMTQSRVSPSTGEGGEGA